MSFLIKASFSLLFVGLFISQSWASLYLGLNPGQGRFNQEAMKDSKTYPVGTSLGLLAGMRDKFFELEGSLHFADYKADIKHDGLSNVILHEHTQATVAINFYLVTEIYLRLGYSFYFIDQSIEKPVSAASSEGIKKEYGLKSDGRYEGTQIGGGWVFLPLTKFQAYVQYDYTTINALDATEAKVSLGLKLKF
jgi:hypothetical protein